MARRPKGSGSIYTRRDGTVVGQYEVDSLNGPKRKYVRGKSKKEVAAKLAKAIAERDSGLVYDPESLTFPNYLDRWLSSTRYSITLGSWKQYEMISRLHVKPTTVGKTNLGRLNSLQLQDLYQRKLDAGLSPRRVRYVHVTVHKALRDAVKWRLVPYNVAEACTPPKLVKREIKPFKSQSCF